MRQAAVLLTLLLLVGCDSPRGLAHRLWGRWDNGDNTLILTPHGLYGLRQNGRTQAGTYGLPSTRELLMQQSLSEHTRRNLFDIVKLDPAALTLKPPEAQEATYTRSAPRPFSDTKLVGLWQRPVGVVHWNFLELTPDGNFVQIVWYWSRLGAAPIRIADCGRCTTDAKGTLRLEGPNGTKEFQYSWAGPELKLQTGSRRPASYRRTTTTRFLER